MATRRDRVLASVETSDDDDRCRCPVAGRPVDRGRGACPNRGVAGWPGAPNTGFRVWNAFTFRGHGPIDLDTGAGGVRGIRPGGGGGSTTTSANGAPPSRAYGYGILCG